MSTLNAKSMADKLYTDRHNHHMKIIVQNASELFDTLHNNLKGPEDFELTLMKTIPADVFDELKSDGFIIEETETCFVLKLPTGDMIDDTQATTGNHIPCEELDPNDLP